MTQAVDSSTSEVSTIKRFAGLANLGASLGATSGSTELRSSGTWAHHSHIQVHTHTHTCSRPKEYTYEYGWIWESCHTKHSPNQIQQRKHTQTHPTNTPTYHHTYVSPSQRKHTHTHLTAYMHHNIHTPASQHTHTCIIRTSAQYSLIQQCRHAHAQTPTDIEANLAHEHK
mgnify:CR=1 FL=1